VRKYNIFLQNLSLKNASNICGPYTVTATGDKLKHAMRSLNTQGECEAEFPNSCGKIFKTERNRT